MEDRERRRRMIESQVAARGVKDARVLAALEAIPRELFVPEDLRQKAYDDRALPIADYQTAILSRLAQQVFSVERHPNLAASAIGRLDALGITNVDIRVGDGTLGLP